MRLSFDSNEKCSLCRGGMRRLRAFEGVVFTPEFSLNGAVYCPTCDTELVLVCPTTTEGP